MQKFAIILSLVGFSIDLICTLERRVPLPLNKG